MITHSSSFSVEIRDSRWSEAKVFCSGFGRDFKCQERALLENVPCPPAPRLLDLLRIASTVFFTDRIVKRDRRNGPSSWPRTISLTLEVADPNFWSDRNITQQLSEVLQFVSGDRWTIRFSRPASEHALGIEWQRPLASTFFPSNPRLCLYSGGLDSAAGLAHQLSLPDDKPIVPITVRHRSDLGNKVRNQLRSFSRLLGHELHSVVVPFEMSSPSKLAQSEETSQRSRAFLFIAVGAAVADAYQVSRLEMYESGVGAINAPLLAGMEGLQATRGSHPHFLYLMSKFVSQISGRTLQVVLPFLGITKGELVASLSRPELYEIANATCSCPSFPIRVHKAGLQQSCGVCAACLFRRLAMYSAGIEEDTKNYQYDFMHNKCDIPRKKTRCLAAFLNQVDCLHETEHGRLPLCIEKHLHQTHVFDHGHLAANIVDLYRRYRMEWIGLIRHAQNSGCKWTELFDLPSKAA